MGRNKFEKIYLHIGKAKTGTIAIQTFCYINRELLEQEGIKWSVEVGEWRADAALPQAGNVDIIFASYLKYSMKERVERLYHMIESYNVSLVSSEDIWVEHYQELYP